MRITVHNPNDLPLVDFRKAIPIQKDLKDLNEANYAKLKKSLELDGFFVPLYIWEDGDQLKLLDGTQRQRVMVKENVEPHQVPYVKIEAKDEADAKKKLLRISSQYGTITQEGYDEFTADLPEAELIETVNFDALSWAKDEEVEEDEAPEVSKEPAKSELGEIYQLGRHRVMCGDSTKKEDIERLMDGKKADMVFTDPPYGMDLDTDYSAIDGSDKFEAKGKSYSKVEGDSEVYDPTELIAYFGSCEQFWWGGDWYYQNLPPGGSWLIWDKRNEASDEIVGNHFESLWSLHRHRREMIRHQWAGITARNREFAREHPTEKPIKVFAKIIPKFSKKDDLVVDPYIGSGTTIMACEQLDRTCYGMELDPKYVDVIRKRYHKLVTDSEEGWEEGTPAISDEKQT